MKISSSPAELAQPGRKACLAIGFFDGVHLGHQQIIRQAVGDAQQHGTHSVVVTFDQHPSRIVAPDRIPPLIQNLDQRLKFIESLGPDALLRIPFTREFSEFTGEAFIRNLQADIGGIQCVCVGNAFGFGHNRSGNVELLRALGTELDFTVHGISAVAVAGETVSSTRIREAIRQGHLDEASQMLGHPYAMAGLVQQGAAMGRKIGFPTANLDVDGLALPPRGVYAAQVLAGDSRHQAVANLGSRPTFSDGDSAIQLEVHLLDFSGDLYNQTIEVIPVARLRDELQFKGVEALRTQIAKDIESARQLL